MRVVQNEQMTVGEVDISKMKFDLKSRDDIPKILRGLQHLYMDVALRTTIFELLDRQIAQGEQVQRAPRHGLVDDSCLWRDPARFELRL